MQIANSNDIPFVPILKLICFQLGGQMGQITRAKEHLTVSEIEQRIKNSKEAWRIMRWMIIRHALVSPQPAA